MSLLKKENWLVFLVLTIMTEGFFNLVIAYLMGLYDKKAWYSNYKYWLYATLCLIFPVIIMFIVFEVQMIVTLARKLEVPGSEIYSNIYVWILCLIVPVIGWIILIVMLLYVIIWPIIMLKSGMGEQFTK